jgi:NADPH2:quinone reductase
MKALTFRNLDSDVLEYIDIPAPALKDEILVEMRDRLNLPMCTDEGQHLKETPFIAGYEGAGVVVDSNNTEFNVMISIADVPFANS